MISEPKNVGSRGVSSIERRKHSRYSFSAAVELMEMRSAARIQGRLSDLGRGGCYIDTISPFGVGAEVNVDLGSTLDHVVVGQDVTALIDDEA